MKDNTGNTVMSALNEEMCKQIAQAGGGAYIHVQNNSAAQEQLDQELDKLEKKETSTAVYSEFDEQFRAFGILALLLLVFEICIFDRRSPLLKRLSLFGSKKQTAVMLLLLVATSAAAQSDRQYIREGNKLFHRGDYPNAEVAYRKAIEKNPKNPQAPFNLRKTLLPLNSSKPLRVWRPIPCARLSPSITSVSSVRRIRCTVRLSRPIRTPSV